jgi:two-component system invasion response regulator UvrY
MVKATVMIIDDHLLVRDAWSVMLRTQKKYKIVAQIGDSTQVEKHLKETHPDVVLLDINMAPLDGFEVLGIIREQSPSTKVIAVSMHSQTVYAKRMMRAGARGYVTKNSPGEELLDAIDVVVNGGKYICKEIKNAFVNQVLEDRQTDINKLTSREIEVIKCLRQGLSSKEIAEQLSIAIKTVEAHRHNILKKLRVNNTVAAIEIANAYGL